MRSSRTRKPLTMLIAVTIALALTAPPLWAQDWEYDFFIYGLGASLDGTTGIGPLNADVDVSFSDILDSLETGGMLAFRAKKDRWAVMADAIFMGLGAANDVVDVDVDQFVFEIDVAYRLTEVVEILAGLRYVDIDAEADFSGPLDVFAEGGDDWIDPVIGLRFEVPLAEKWLLISRVDAGGLGTGSDFTTNAVLSFGYHLSERSTLVFGWRAIDIDFEDGEGRERFKYDVLSSGPMIGFAFHL